MIVESSGILALRRREPDANRYETAIASALNCRMSVANLLEVFIVVESRGGAAAGHECDAFFDKAGIEWVPVTPEHAEAARRAWRRFGKGNHPAGLNFGDCFAYALARTAGEPLLFKGRISPAPISRRHNRRNSACRRRPQGSSTSTTARASGDSRAARPTTRDPTRAPGSPGPESAPSHAPHGDFLLSRAVAAEYLVVP